MMNIALDLWNLLALMAVGFIVARLHGVGKGADRVLSRLIFNVFLPAMLFATMEQSDVHGVFSLTALVNIVQAIVLFVAFYLLAVKVFQQRDGTQTILALTASYTNVGNLGVAYLAVTTGHPEAGAPIILFQMCVMAPLSFVLLERQTNGEDASVLREIARAFTKPPIVGLLLGLAVALMRLAGMSVVLPSFIQAPLTMVVDATVPLLMVALGVSFGLERLPRLTGEFVPMYAAVAGRVVIGPLLSWLLALAFHLPTSAVLTAVVVGCFPTANNVFIYAQRYGAGVETARDGVALSTVLSMPALLIAVALLG
ncbi:MAG: AEC family transporter [Actinomycetaceae bacterium]|nr:AEC family transporter [Arcanobacterium sp.]MDD7687123.1 AEC family transporter [Actinomycetaceae bacterium]MDY5273212.1 AEC family transporter [Arcanobacterium sp.]